jgi:serine/threonine protein kinase
MQSDKAVHIFVSYAHKDEAWRKALFGQSISTPSGLCTAWTDDMIEPGSRWDETIDKELNEATVAVLLVSKHFLKSLYIGRKELPFILKKRLSDGLKLLWIPIGNIGTVQGTELASIQAACPLKKPLTARPRGDPSILDKVVEEVRDWIQAAIDPVGVPLMRRLSKSHEPFSLICQTDMSMVYKSRDRNLERPVAIKALIDTDKLDHFRQNARDAARIADEPNFVKLYEAVVTTPPFYCVMQYVEGPNLRTWIESDNRRPLAVVIRILSKVTKALIAAHALGASYGNLRPSNIVLATNNEPYILPMGRRVNDRRGPKVLDELERRSPEAEKIAYLAPEQFDDEIETVSGELSDQYMLGLLAYELITGTLPPSIGNKAPSLASLAEIRRLRGAAFNDLPLVSDLRPDCSEELARIIQRMCKRRPQDRYPSLADLLRDVRRQEDVALTSVRDSYDRCMEEQRRTGKSFFEAFYKTFFERRQDAVPLFENLGARHNEILEKTVLGLFSFYEQERARAPNEPNVLTDVAQKHDRQHRNIGLDFYAPFTEALIDTACGAPSSSAYVFDPRCRDHEPDQSRMRSAWRDVLQPGVEYMKSKY